MNKFRNNLRKFGMEKEFEVWLKDIKDEKHFPIGSRIRITSLPKTIRTIYHLGDEGTIVSSIGRKISAESFKEFGHLPIVRFDFGDTYFIQKERMTRI